MLLPPPFFGCHRPAGLKLTAGMEGDHAIVVGGYAKLVDALAQHTQARGGGGARRAGAPSELAASPPALP